MLNESNPRYQDSEEDDHYDPSAPSTHDQLPSVEQCKTDIPTGSSSRNRRRLRRLLVAVLIAVTIIIVVVIVVAGEMAHNKNQGSRYSATTSYVAKMQWSSVADLHQDGSPQHLAAVWLADLDEAQIPLNAAHALILMQRYVLAVFYYATDGPTSWDYHLSFLSGNDVCSWSQDFGTLEVPVGGVEIGIGCLGDGTVSRLFFPKIGLSGTLPTELGLLTNMRAFDLRENDLFGTLPFSLGKWSQLQLIDVKGNALTGSLPTWLGSLGSLEHMRLARNQLAGSIPAEYRSLSNLNSFHIYSNQLTGTLDALIDMPQLKGLLLSLNHLTGTLSVDMLNSWPSLAILDLGGNNLNGSIPENLWAHGHLLSIDLSNNNFSGPLPVVFDPNSPSRLEYLDLQNNKVTGPMSNDALRYSRLLHHLDLSYNLLSGSMPEWIGDLSNLVFFFLAGNEMLEVGTIPTSLGRLSALIFLSLQSTNRNGTLPTELGALDKLELLDVNSNQLTGSIPNDLASLTNLEFALFKDNRLTGTLPQAMSSWTQLRTLYLERNQLSPESNTSAILCSGMLPTLFSIGIDCDLGACDCCQYCCASPDDITAINTPQCDNVVFYAGLDPSWDYLIAETTYEYKDEGDIIYPPAEGPAGN